MARGGHSVQVAQDEATSDLRPVQRGEAWAVQPVLRAEALWSPLGPLAAIVKIPSSSVKAAASRGDWQPLVVLSSVYADQRSGEAQPIEGGSAATL